MFSNIINFFKKINIFTHAVERALKIKQDIDHIDEKEFIYIDFNENQSSIKLSFKDIKEEYSINKEEISFDRVYKFLLKHFRYYPYNIIFNGSMLSKEYDPFFESYSFNTNNNDSDDTNHKTLEELKSLYKKEFNSSFDDNNCSIIYFTEVYPYKVKIVLFISNEHNLDESNYTDSMDNFDNIDSDEDRYSDNFRIYNSSILYTDSSFPCIPEFLYKIHPQSTVKLIANIEGIDSLDMFKSQNIQNFLTKKLADIISSKIQQGTSNSTITTTTTYDTNIDNADNNTDYDYIRYWKKFSFFIKQAVVLDPLFFSKIKDNLIIELKNGKSIYLNINDFLKDKDRYKYFDKYKLNINPNYSKIEYDYINFLTDQIGSSILLDLL